MSKKSSAGLALMVTLLASLHAGPAAAAFLSVPEDHTTIAAALAAAVHGDTVSLAMGTYYEHDLVLPSGVSLVGRSGSPQTVIIDAQNLGRVVVGEDLDEQNVLAYFTARAGNSQWWPGAGLYLSGPCTLRNLIVEDCTVSGSGIGAHCTYPALIEDCVFRNNRSTGTESKGGGLLIVPIPVSGSIVRRTDLVGNEAAHGAAIWVSASDPIVFDSIRVVQNLGLSAIELYNGEAWGGTRTFLIENSLIAGNSGTGISAIASGTVRNCTIADCRSGIVSAGSNASDCYVLIENCVVTGSCDPSGFGGITSWYDGQQGYPDVYCSDVYKNLPTNYSGMFDQTGINGNISVDPRFCADAGPEDYPLRKDSPCAPANNTCGVLMGAFPVGCDATATEETSWSRVKSLY
jgi:hypothetical protein